MSYLLVWSRNVFILMFVLPCPEKISWPPYNGSHPDMGSCAFVRRTRRRSKDGDSRVLGSKDSCCLTRSATLVTLPLAEAMARL